MSKSLFTLHVQLRVQPAHVERFQQATLENAAASRQEPGVVRFDVFQDREDPTRFVLVEVYRSEDAPPHKQTAHYEKWRQTVEPILAEERTRRTFDTLSPAPEAW
jgi:autoinducer 2-degrading protein